MAIKISGSTIIDDSRNIVNAGVVTATAFVGDGSGLTGVSGGGSVGVAGTWAVTSVGIHTTKNVGIGTTNPTSRLTVQGDGRFTGVVTATRFESTSAGTPTIDSPNNLNINAVTVAISTDTTIGGRLIVSGISTLNSGGINVAGVVTAFKFVGDGSSLTGVAAAFTGAASTITSGQISNWNTAYGWGNHAVVGYATTGYVDTQIGIKTFSGNYNHLTNRPTIPVNLDDLSDVNAGAPSTGQVLKWSGSQWQASPDLTASGAGIGLSDLSVTINPAGINSLTYNNTTGVFLFTPTNLSGYLTTETSHADVVVDGDFTSQGLMRRGSASGTYTIVTDNSSDWNTAYGWGNHAVVGYVTAGYVSNASVSFATTAGIATYATSAGVAAYAPNAGVATYSTSAGVATYANLAGVSTYSTISGVATYTNLAGVSTYSTISGVATYSSLAGVATYASLAGVATYSSLAGVATYASTSGVSTTSGYSTTSGVSTLAQGLTGTPNIVVGIVTATRIETASAGTPTIDSPNNLNINAVTVAISTDVTIGGDITSVGDITSSGTISANLITVGSVAIGTDSITGPSQITIDPDGVGDNTGLVVIKGDLQVDGTQTTINSTTLTVDDKNIVLASGAANAAAADGGGVTIDGANATLTYVSTGDKWVFNKTPYFNLARILTTDDEGTGNGLDADTIDGLQSTQFLRSDTNINITNYSVGIGTTSWPSSSLGYNADFYVTNKTLWTGGSGIWTGRNYYVGVASDGITLHAPSISNFATDGPGKEFRIYTNSDGQQRFVISQAPAWVATVVVPPDPDPSDPELHTYTPLGNWKINGNETFQVGGEGDSFGDSDGFAKITQTLQIGTSFYPYSKGVFIDADRRTIAVGAAITMNGRTGIVTAVGFHGRINSGISTLGIATATSLNVSGVVTATSFVGSNTLKSRTIVSGTTTSIANNGIGNTNITGFKSYSLMKVGLSTAGWLRLYTDSASRTADASRSQGVDPAPGSGVIAEVITTGISTTQIITPFVMGGNLDDPADTTIYAAITNLSGVTTSISVNLTILQLEV